MSQDGSRSRSSNGNDPSGGSRLSDDRAAAAAATAAGAGAGAAIGRGADDQAKVLKTFYKAVASGDVNLLKGLVGPDIEWWFHGPASEQHLMRMLTGVDRLGSLAFKPTRISSVQKAGCGKLIAEGFLLPPKSSTVVSWVHVFTIVNGKIAELREYFNSSVTVTSSTPATLWQSQVAGTSMPGLIVAV